MQKYIYRTATMLDVEGLKLLGFNSFGQFKDQLADDHWKKLETSLKAEITYIDLLNKSTCFICEVENNIVGMAFLVPSGNPTDIFHQDWSYMRMVGVNTQFAGRGIGKNLTRMCIDHAKNTKEKIVALHTSEFMDAARHIYESAGFFKDKELEPRLGKRYWLYLLELG